MSPEQALVVIVALLWGPTAIWLILRFARGPRDSNRRIGMGDDARDAGGELIWPTPGVKELAELVDQSEFWVCEACRSINRPGTKRCYACRLKRGEAVPRKAAEPATPDMVPVMAEPAAPDPVPVMADAVKRPVEARPGSPAAKPLAPAASAYIAGQWVAASTGAEQAVRAPVGARARTQPAVASLPDGAVGAEMGEQPPLVVSGGTAGGGTDSTDVPPAIGRTPGPATDRVDEAAPPIAAGSTARVAAAASLAPAAGTSGAARVCPFVRLEGDRTTWYDFPHPGNLCHALAGESGTRQGGLAGLFGGRLTRNRPEVTTPEVQSTLCLTAAHVQCVRFRAGRGTAPAAPATGAGAAAPTEMIAPTQAPDPSAPPPVAPAASASSNGEARRPNGEPGRRNGEARPAAGSVASTSGSEAAGSQIASQRPPDPGDRLDDPGNDVHGREKADPPNPEPDATPDTRGGAAGLAPPVPSDPSPSAVADPPDDPSEPGTAAKAADPEPAAQPSSGLSKPSTPRRRSNRASTSGRSAASGRSSTTGRGTSSTNGRSSTSGRKRSSSSDPAQG